MFMCVLCMEVRICVSDCIYVHAFMPKYVCTYVCGCMWACLFTCRKTPTHVVGVILYILSTLFVVGGVCVCVCVCVHLRIPIVYVRSINLHGIRC